MGKRLGRMAFDAAYSIGLGGQGIVELTKNDGRVRLHFDARKRHYASLYLNQYEGGYETEVASLLETFLTGDRVFYDIGSNWGYFALYGASKLGYEGAVHAFEPVAQTFDDLTKWVEQSSLSARITCHRLALSNQAGSGRMQVDSLASGLARVIAAEEDNGLDVTLAVLDDLDLPPPDVMKIDVEEHELEVFQGASAVLAKHKPMMVFENWLAPERPEITLAPLRFLEAKGYDFYQPLWRLEDGGFAWPGPHRPLPHGRYALALLPFSWQERFTLRDQINVFACHHDRMGALQDVLTPA